VLTESVSNPNLDLTLRVSGSLLLGVVRIFSYKVKYLSSDCDQALTKMKMVSQLLHSFTCPFTPVVSNANPQRQHSLIFITFVVSLLVSSSLSVPGLMMMPHVPALKDLMATRAMMMMMMMMRGRRKVMKDLEGEGVVVMGKALGRSGGVKVAPIIM